MSMSDKALARDAARYARERGVTDVEHRTTLAPVTLRAKSNGDSGQTFEGLAVRYSSETWIGFGDDDPWGFYEEVAPGAFDEDLRANVDVVCVYNHDLNYMLGRTASGTLRLTSGKVGLSAVNDLPDTTVGRDLGVLVARQDVAGMSFSFMPKPGGDHWTVAPDGRDKRTLTNCSIFDVAPCVLPAYGDTTASVRAVSLGRRNSPRPFISIPETVQRAQKSEKESDNDDNGADDGTDDAAPKGARSIMQPDDGSIEIDDDGADGWQEIQRNQFDRLMLERMGWDL